jgi:hypothetical protein
MTLPSECTGLWNALTDFLSIRVDRRMVMRIAVALAGFVFALQGSGVIDARQDDANSFRENFPHVVDEDWQAFAANLALGTDSSADAFVDRILASIANVSLMSWREGTGTLSVPGEASVDTIESLKSAPVEKAGQPFQYAGKVREVIRCRDAGVAGEDASGLKVLVDAGGGKTLWVIPFHVPRRLAARAASAEASVLSDQAVAGHGVFAGLADGVPVLVSPRLEWRPDHVADSLGVNNGQVVLAKTGFDCGLLDSVRNFTTVAITADEAVAFSELMKAAMAISRHPEKGTLMQSAIPFDLESVARHPAANAGGLLDVRGMLRRITPVTITSPSMRESLGLSVYYHLDLFVPLGNRRVLLGEGKEGKPVEFSGSYGITIIASELPEELLNAEPDKPQLVELKALMFKVWMHSSLSTEASSPDLRRPNPVLIAIPGEFAIAGVGETGQKSRTEWLIFLLLVFAVAILGLVWWKRQPARPAGKREPLPQHPDFSGLNRMSGGRDSGETESSP